MTFEEALKLKSSLPKEVLYNETWLQIHIVPLKNEDFTDFMKYYYANKGVVNEIIAKRFCTDNQYTLHGLNRMGTINLFLTLPNLLDVCNNK